MYRKTRHILLSRKTVLALILLLLGGVVLAYVFPQRFLSSSAEMERWQRTHLFWAPWVARLGLDHVYTTGWFASLLGAFCLSLTVSCWDQLRLAARRTLTGALPVGRHHGTHADGQAVESAIRGEGYVCLGSGGGARRFVRHPWGYWGNALLHLGMVIALTSSLVIVLTQKRGLVELVEGEIHSPGSPWTSEDRGTMAERFALPQRVRLDTVAPEFWETDDLKQVTSSLSFLGPDGAVAGQQTLAINRIGNLDGIHIYQGQRFGNAFYVVFTDNSGRAIKKILQMQSPLRRDTASYENISVDGIPYLIKAKYYADAERKSMADGNPLLVLRLVDEGKVIAELPLKKGEEGELGPYRARLVHVSHWAELVFTGYTGMPGIFLGFFIIILGGGLSFFTPPRELFVTREENGVALTCRSGRFDHSQGDECARILAALRGEDAL